MKRIIFFGFMLITFFTFSSCEKVTVEGINKEELPSKYMALLDKKWQLDSVTNVPNQYFQKNYIYITIDKTGNKYESSIQGCDPNNNGGFSCDEDSLFFFPSKGTWLIKDDKLLIMDKLGAIFSTYSFDIITDISLKITEIKSGGSVKQYVFTAAKIK